MAGQDEEADLLRGGAMTLRARLASLQHKLNDERQAREKAEQDAAAMARFIATRVNVKSWEHADVMALVEALHVAMAADLSRTARRMAASGTVASHVLYDREMARARKDARAAAVALVKEGMTRPDMLSPAMREDLLRRLDELS